MDNCTREHCGGQLALLWTDGGQVEVCLQCRRTPNQVAQPNISIEQLRREGRTDSYVRRTSSR